MVESQFPFSSILLFVDVTSCSKPLWKFVDTFFFLIYWAVTELNYLKTAFDAKCGHFSELPTNENENTVHSYKRLTLFHLFLSWDVFLTFNFSNYTWLWTWSQAAKGVTSAYKTQNPMTSVFCKLKDDWQQMQHNCTRVKCDFVSWPEKWAAPVVQTDWKACWDILWAVVSVSAKCCHCISCCLLFTWSDKLLVQSHYRGCTQAVYLCMGLCHCHSHSHAGYLLIFHSHIPICPSPPPPNLLPSAVMNSFSRFSLPITSPSLLHPSFFCLSHLFT